jgi:DNA repair exonuclease SbcCD nuclease subunit
VRRPAQVPPCPPRCRCPHRALAAEKGAEFVLVCGDVFETNQLDRAIIARTFEVLNAFTVPVVLLPGNHDPLDAASIYDSPAFSSRVPSHVHVLRDSEPFTVVPGVEIIGAPWFSKHPQGDLVAAATTDLAEVAAGDIRIIAGHGAVSVLDPDGNRWPRSTPTICGPCCARTGPSSSPSATGTRPIEVADRIWYPGAPEVTSRRETDPGNVLLVDIDADTHRAWSRRSTSAHGPSRSSKPTSTPPRMSPSSKSG